MSITPILIRYVWIVSIFCIAWFSYSCATLLTNKHYSVRIPDNSYKILEVNPGNVDVSATITINYAGQNYSVPVTEEDLNHHKLHKKFFFIINALTIFFMKEMRMAFGDLQL